MAVATKKGSDLLTMLQGMVGGYDATSELYDALTIAAHELSVYDLPELRETLEYTVAKNGSPVSLEQKDADAPPILAVLWVRDETSNRRLRRDDLYRFMDEDETSLGPPARWARDGMRLYLSPVPDGSYKLRIRVKLRHPDITANETILFPRDWHRLLLYRAAELVADTLPNPERATYFAVKAERLLAERLAGLPHMLEDVQDVDAGLGVRVE